MAMTEHKFLDFTFDFYNMFDHPNSTPGRGR
jgi:hypothetical protein